ncbi:hypothetical protein [Lyngbya sp. CCY1209]|uniref:hypothetical protein n=1 Tax=Lyngbya sp. CCY1209 TaxID=2886103 RepID=UPI002D2074FC|nr:hypothetical protein [Lyngbya sp. CCY1209]MEB3885477.1 hypothetical protein [Lyngbya sp. CCY1209]
MSLIVMLKTAPTIWVASCVAPGPVQWMAIIALICGSGVLIVFASTSLLGVATTFASVVVPMILAGATISEIIAVITGSDLFILSGSIEALTGLIAAIQSLLSC